MGKKNGNGKQVTNEKGQPFIHAIFNLKPKLLRNDKMADKDYLVVPMVMLTEGVHAGSEGPYLYTKDEIAKRPQLWNMKPIVVYHPDEPSACTPAVLNARQIGVIMNTGADKEGRLTAEAWLDEERVKKVDNRILEAIKNEETLELSTGLFADSDETPGEWEGEEYNGTLKNFGPDHLAVLPDQVGACSIEDGAGFYRNAEGKRVVLSKSWTKYFNELSSNTIRDQLSKLIAKKDEYRWVEDVFDNYFIWSSDAGLYKQDYEIDGDTVSVKGMAEQVVRKFIYEPVKNETKTITNEGNETMDKKKLVDALIANKAFEEKDREMLTALDERVLTNMAPKAPTAPEKLPEPAPVVTPQNAQPKQMTEAEYLATMPPSFRNQWERMKKAEQAQKDKAITAILANKRNTFTKEYLNTKDVEELENLANLAGSEEAESQSIIRFNYGMGGPPQDNGNADADKLEPLTQPVFNWAEKKAKMG